MPGTLAWVALLLAAVMIEVAARRRPDRRWLTLPATLRTAGARLPGRLVILAVWAFIGWHVFARYTLPGHR